MHDSYNPTKKKISICLDVSIVDYFKGMAIETGVPYQRLINLYLRDCVKSHKVVTTEEK